MKKKDVFLSFLVVLNFLLVSCGKEIAQPLSRSIAGVEVVFLDATSSYEYQKDNSRYINQQIQQIDVSIIIEEDLSSLSVEKARETYIKNLQKNTLNWKEKEVANFQKLLKDIFVDIDAETQKVLPDTLYMIKTTGDETIGKGAMYTISKSIVIPKMNTSTAGLGFLQDEVKEVLRHELFHLYSNINPEVRPDLYEVMGFYPIDLDLKSYKKRIIANPDTDYEWAVELEREGRTIEAVLLTYSNYEKWEGNKSKLGLKSGKGYLDYGLFEVKNIGGTYQLKSGLSEIEISEVESSFRAKIGNNTDYTWAVEEIIADTYPLLFQVNEGASERDLEIIESLKELLN